MVAKLATSNGHSADVRMTLFIDGQQLSVAQAGGDSIVLREPALLHSTAGVLVISIDGHEDRWRVTIAESDAPTREYMARFFSPYETSLHPHLDKSNSPNTSPRI